MYILGLPYQLEQINEALASTWNKAFKSEAETRNLPSDIVKSPEPFIKGIQMAHLEGVRCHLPKF